MWTGFWTNKVSGWVGLLKTLDKTLVAHCLLTLLVKTKSQICMEHIAFTACHFIVSGLKIVLPVRKKKGKVEKVGKGRTDTPLGRSFSELLNLFSAPINPMKQRERCLSMWRAEIRYWPKFHLVFTFL